jgi:hypothetical protein
MKSYFQNFPKIEYQTPEGKISCSDLMTRFKFLDSVQSDPFAIYEYELRDGDRPDIIAHRYYKNADLAWIVMLSSDLFSVKDSFVLSDDELQSYIEYSYGITLEESYTQIHHYEDDDGFVVDYATMIGSGGEAISVYDHEFKLNNDKRKLKLISNRYVKQITDELEAHLISIKKEQ